MCQAGPVYLWIYLILLLSSSLTSAKNYDVYRADYAKGAFCVALAGACASDNNPENSFFQNPASLQAGSPDWVYDGDYNPSDNTEPGMKTSNEISDATYMGGIAKSGDEWGVGIAFSGRLSNVKAQSTIFDDSDIGHPINTTNSSTTLMFNIPIAKKVTPQFTAGVAVIGLYYRETLAVEGSSASKTTAINKLPKLGLSIGGLYSINSYFRVGSWLRLPITYDVNQYLKYQGFGSPVTINETVSLMYPYMSATGISIMPWADQRTIFFDIDVIGTTLYGYERTLDSFERETNDHVLRAKGRIAVLEPHLAWRSPWWAGSDGTYTVGAYYETSRWRDLPSRFHGVVSVAYKFSLGEPIVALDYAKDFMGLQISFR